MKDNSNLANNKKRVTLQQRFIALSVFIGITTFFLLGWLILRGFLNPELLFGICGFKEKYHLPCPACGMTSSVLAFLSGDIGRSFYLQPAAGVLCSVLFCGWVCSFMSVLGFDLNFIYKRLLFIQLKYWLIGIIIVVLGGWSVTMARALAEI